MANITVLEALQLSLNATKKYVDDNKFSKNYEDLNNEPFTFVPIKLTETNESNGAITAYCDVFDLEQGHRYVADFTKYDYVCLYTFNSDNTKNTLVATTSYLSTSRNGMITIMISSATKRDILWMSAYGSERITVTKNSDGTFAIANSLIVPRVTNTREFTPTSDYHLVHKKYVDENNQLYWMEPYEITGTKTKLANVDISTLTKNRLYTFNYKKYSEINKVGIKKIYDDGTKKSITTLNQGLEYIYFSDLSSIGFTMYIKYSHGTSSKITGTFGSTASEYTSTLTPMVLDTQSNKEFIPTKEYDPATKKYVDEKVAEANASGGYTHPDSHPASMITGLATVATSGDYNDLTNRLLKVLPSNTTATDLYNLEAGVYLTEGQINFNILDDAQLYNGIEPYVIFPNSLIASRGGGEITNLSYGIYYTFNPEGYIVYAGTVNNAWGAPPAHSIPDELSDELPASTNAVKNYVDANKFSGNYNDLTNKPTIPSTEGLATETYVNNKVAGLIDSAPEALNTLNELATALGNDANFATTISNQIGLKANSTDLATVATSGSYNDLSDKPTIPAAYTHPASHPASMITGLHTVATSGDYNDLNNKPSIPTVTNDLTNELKANYDAAYTHSTSAHAPSNAQKNSDITKSEIEAKLTGDITSHTHSQYIDNIELGTKVLTKTNTTEYTPTGDYNPATKKYVDDNKFSGSYNDLTNKPTIPTTTSQLTNDSGYITSSSIPSSLPANGGNADTVGGYTIWVGTQAQYNGITSKSSTTIYLIKEG